MTYLDRFAARMLSDRDDNGPAPCHLGCVDHHRGYHITYWRKPIPTDAFDYDFSHDDYDGAEDSHDHRCGSARSIEAAKAAIDEIEDDQ